MSKLPQIQCPECGPHGNNGRVALFSSLDDCLTCKKQDLLVNHCAEMPAPRSRYLTKDQSVVFSTLLLEELECKEVDESATKFIKTEYIPLKKSREITRQEVAEALAYNLMWKLALAPSKRDFDLNICDDIQPEKTADSGFSDSFFASMLK